MMPADSSKKLSSGVMSLLLVGRLPDLFYDRGYSETDSSGEAWKHRRSNS